MPFTEQILQKVTYNRAFEGEFGSVDPNQTWDLFGQLNTRGAAPAATRAASPDEVSVADDSPVVVVEEEDATEYEDMLPESDDDPRPYSSTNLGRVTQDFIASARTFTIAPVHWYTSGSDHIGIYWYTDDSEQDGAVSIKGQDGKMYYIIRKQIYENKTHLKGYKESDYYKEETYLTDTQFERLAATYPEKYIISTGNEYNQYGGVIAEGTHIIASGEKVMITGTSTEVDKYYTQAEISKSLANTTLLESILNDIKAVFTDTEYVIADGSDAYKDGEDNASGTTYSKYSLIYLTTVKTEVGTSNVYSSYGMFQNGAEYLESTPITVTVPSSIPTYGFYITNGNLGDNNSTRYSEANLNPNVNFSDKGVTEGHFVATYNRQDYIEGAESQQFLCFEDWMGTATNFDLNDVVFTIKGLDKSTIIDQDAINEAAMLVCEDLSLYDFDFNDIALKLNYYEKIKKTYIKDASGKVVNVQVADPVIELTVTPMAAGGAYKSDVYYGIPSSTTGTTAESTDPTAGQTKWGEIHELLGGSAPTIINAGAKFPEGGEGTPKIIGNAELPAKNVGTEDGQYPTFLSQLFAQGFFTIVGSHDGVANKIITNNSYTETGNAPQMMLLPVTFEWPQEMHAIKLAYTGFMDWVEDVTKTGWIYDTQVPDSVTDRGDFTPKDDPNIKEEEESQEYGESIPLHVVPTGVSWTYVNEHDASITTTYSHGSFIDFTGIVANEGAKAEITLTFSVKPTSTIYLDDKNGIEILKDEDASGPGTTTYTLTAAQVARVIQTGGIYVIARYVNGSEPTVTVTEASIRLTEGTNVASRHNLYVTPESVTINRENETVTIDASSATGATITYTSTDTNVATVDANGVVTPVADGEASITVVALASGSYTQNSKMVPVTVKLIPDGFEEGDECDKETLAGNYRIQNYTDIVSAGKAKFGINISGETPGTVITVQWGGGSYSTTITIEESKTLYTFETTNVQNIQYNNLVTISGMQTGTVNSFWAKAGIGSGGGGEGGDSSSVTLTLGTPSESYVLDMGSWSCTVQNTIATTAQDLSEWENGASIVINYVNDWSTGNGDFLRVLDPSGNVIAGDTNNHYAQKVTYTLTARQIADCLVSGEYQFKIEYPMTRVTLSNVTLTKTE